MARRYALVVGISQYKSPLKSLSKTVTDAEAVANVLRSQGGFQDVTPLTGEVNSKKLSEALRQLLLEQAKGNDALIYFTGHGIPVIDPLMGEPKGYLATSDCVVSLQGTQVVEQQRGIAIASLNQLIQKSELSSLVVLLDCCHSGDFLERQVVEQSFTAFRGRQDYYLITACRGFEQAYAKKQEQHSIFNGALLEGLSESQADEEGNVTGDSLSAFIKRELRGSGQEPISMGFGGTITLVSYGTQINATKIDETCPYQGLEPFTEATQQFFFGRRNVVEQLRQKLESASFVALIGASGSGKSSVVRAGLVPQVRESGWRVLEPIKPGFDPLSELKRVFANQFHRRDEIQQVYEAIASGSLDPIVDLLPGTERILLLVDQFEEVFTVCADEEARRSLIHLITQVQSTRLAVIITMRADFLEPCLNYANLTQQLQQHQVLIPPLEGKALEEAIAKPAQKQGYTVEPALLSVIQRDVAQEKNCLPLLQFALQSLWNAATQAGHQLKLEQYEQLNGIAGALKQHGDRIYDWQDWREASPTRHRNPQEQEWIKRLCLKLVRTGEDTRDTRQRQPKADLLALAGEDAENQAMVETVLTDLVDGRLLVTDQETENPTEQLGSIAHVDLAHEALMEGWQRFADWRKDDRELRRLCDRLEDARREWEQHQRNPDFLLSRGLLVQVEAQQEQLEPYLNFAVREFYQISKDKEQEREAVIEWARSEGALEARANEAIRLLQKEPLAGVALLLQLVKLNLEKINLFLLEGIQKALYQALIFAPYQYKCLRGYKDAVWSVAFSPDGTHIVSGSEDKTIRLWDVEGNPIGQPFQGHESSVNSVAFSPDDTRIVSGSGDKTIRLWDVEGNPIGQPFQGHDFSVMAVAFSPDGTCIVSGSADKTIRLWDVEGNPIGHPFQGHESYVNSVAFSSDGTRIVSGSGDKTIRLWDVEGNPIGHPFQGHESSVWSVAFSPDGTRIVSGSEDKTIRLWDVEGNPIGHPFQGHESHVNSVAFSLDGTRIVSGSKDKTIRLWDLEKNPIAQPLAAHELSINSIVFGPDGKRILSGSSDKTIRLWDLEGNPIAPPFQGHKSSVSSVAFSPDGSKIVSGSSDATIYLWDLEGNIIGSFIKGHKSSVNVVIFSPNGQFIMSGSDDATVRLWDLEGNPIGQPFQGHEDSVKSVAISPDGTRIVSGSEDRTIRLWDLDGNPIGQPFQGHEDSVCSVAFSPDGTRIVSGSEDQTIRLWDLEGNLIGLPFQGHQDAIWSVAFSPDGTRIASSSDDLTIRLWDLDGNPIGLPFHGHEGSIWSVAFSPDGTRLVSGSFDQTIRLWRGGSWQDCLEICCNRIRHHPYFTNPQTEEARAAYEVCEKYVWSREENREA
ncbi:MAG: caspase family protein [Synechococcales bacterium]|nr:caspase family protein [Synechococcales bacterium]